MGKDTDLNLSEALSEETNEKVLIPQYCTQHNTPITHICIQTDCKNRKLCLQCNATHDNTHHKRIYSLNTALNNNELSLLFDQVETKYSNFEKAIDQKIEEVITQSNQSFKLITSFKIIKRFNSSTT